MNDPHVEKLHYEITIAEHTDYDKASSIEEETDDFIMSIDGKSVIFSMKKHFADEVEARKYVDDYIRWNLFTRKWEALIGIQFDSDEFRYRFIKADIIDRTPQSDDNQKLKSVMDKKEALKIIRMIAEGEDPYKDESRSKYLPEHNPKTLKALCTAIASMFPIDDQENGVSSGQPLMLDNFLKGLAEKFIKKLGKDAIVEALIKADYKKDEASEILGITYTELLNKIKKYDVSQEIELRVLLRPVETDYRYILNQISLDEYLETIEKNAIIKALEKRALKQEAADLLGTSFRTLRYRIEKLSIGLKNTASLSSITVTSDYFKHSSKEMSLDEFLKTVEKKIIEMALEETDLKQDAAERLGISFRTLRYRIEKLGIE